MTSIWRVLLTYSLTQSHRLDSHNILNLCLALHTDRECRDLKVANNTTQQSTTNYSQKSQQVQWLYKSRRYPRHRYMTDAVSTFSGNFGVGNSSNQQPRCRTCTLPFDTRFDIHLSIYGVFYPVLLSSTYLLTQSQTDSTPIISILPHPYASLFTLIVNAVT